ncbi:MAG: VCBS repeat-containing protein [Ginsengibacter sp.]
MNPLNHINIYNGGGVGIGDFNNDGLQDVYFTGNMVSNKLYLNKGNMKFEDITEFSNTLGGNRSCRGVSVIDINNDGKQDIYVCVTLTDDPQKRKNILYVNQGVDEKGIPVFKDMAPEYGLDDSTHTTMAYFFDYDNDGDLDVYLVVNEHLPLDNPSKFRPVITDGSHPSTDRLFRNDWNDSLGHPYFENVSAAAGITLEGYGHAAIITDINLDGWKDIYVTNDFLSNNILYINNQNGTFTDRSKEYFKQTSTFAMGVDMQDLNNDGLLDVVELDMNPQDNYRKKMMLGSNSYQTLQNFANYNYQYQYSKNSLQLNGGSTVKENDSIGPPIFSQVSFQSGISETDWSWAPLISDFDDDGYRDIIITNGYPKDVTDHDFMIYRSAAAYIASWNDIARQIPEVKLHNYAYKNNGDARFDDMTKEWGLMIPSFSNGGAYADLDNDGDMDIVVNNINDAAFIYENNSSKENRKGNNYLNVTFAGSQQNFGGFGSWVKIYYGDGKQQVYENSPYRSYISSVQNMAHFGLGNTPSIDSLVIVWPGAKTQVIKNIKANQVLNLDIKNAASVYSYNSDVIASHTLFKEVTQNLGIDYTHKENDFIDFNIQKLLPHKLSEYSPALAVGDVDGDGLDDLICGGNSVYPSTIFYQHANGKFTEQKLFNNLSSGNIASEVFKDEGILLFDADGDGDNDMYIARGGYIQKPGSTSYQDQFYVNDGKGHFILDSTSIPSNLTSKFCVRAADYDNDGDLDLFIAGRVEPWNYPNPVSCILLRNDSKKNKIKFTDVTATVGKDLLNIGMVCDAVFTDFDNDGLPDIIMAGEWMPITFLKNENGIFKNVTASSGVENYLGWWNSIAPGDFDNDGDIDYIVGNLGLNSFYKASDKYPVSIVAKDFDQDGNYDAFPFIYLPVSHENKEMKEFPASQRDDAIKQMISMRGKFPNYKQYAFASKDSILSAKQLQGALTLKANMFASAMLRNDGNGKFSITQLPLQAQVSVLNGMVVDDFDGDGNLDVIMNGNDYGTDVSIGHYDALNGLLLKGDGKGNFFPQSILQSGIYIPGNGKALVELRNKAGDKLIAASQHHGPLKVFELKNNPKAYPIDRLDVSAVIKYKNGVAQKREFYYGYSFLSQSARFVSINDKVVSLTIRNSKNQERSINLDH